MEEKRAAVETILRELKQVLVAFSGGVDSTFLLAMALETLGRDAVLAVTGESASLASHERTDVVQLVTQLNAPHQFLSTEELENPSYVANPSNRCFFCKDELYGKLTELAVTQGMVIVDGLNASDLMEFGPGRQAAEKWGVRHPLAEAGLTKEDIRVLSRAQGLPTWGKPASPCLSSRIPYGRSIKVEELQQVEGGEQYLRALGFRNVRVRHYGDWARIEVDHSDVPRLLAEPIYPALLNEFRTLGFLRVVVDPAGFRSGNLNPQS
ncbi:MAG: ATP-dependent sacrificial sulfur transferase LarE [Elusimicrobia bacterium]|nr:ATP-dependent sacrificial sulfur transferase LarE [Elusimicrobiota bacterium]